MALGTTAVTTLQRVKSLLMVHGSSPSFQVPALAVYYKSTGPATVEVTDVSVILVDDAATTTTLFSGSTTITAMATAINAVANWNAEELTHTDAVSTDLVPTEAISALSVNDTQVLKVVANRDLELIIEAVSDEIEKYLQRNVVIRSVEDVQKVWRLADNRQFVLSQGDIEDFSRLQIGQGSAMTVTYTGAASRAQIEVTDTSIIYTDSNGTTDDELLFSDAANDTVTEVVAVIEALAGWSATLVTAGPSTHLARTAGRAAKDRVLDFVAWEDLDGDYDVRFDSGVVTMSHGLWWPIGRNFAANPKRVRALYTAGIAATTAAVPHDIQQIAASLVAQEWLNRGRNLNVQSESLGDYSYTTQSNGQDVAKDWQDRLSGYKRNVRSWI